ncbi:MAG: ComEC/Rec2 family competence protein, partial [Balneolaceae bacterium]
MEARGTYQFPFSKYPAVRIALLLIAGILLYHFINPTLLLITGSISFLFVAFIATEWRNSKRISVILPSISALLFMLIIISFGAFRLGIQQKIGPAETVQLIEVMPWEEIEITGAIQSISTTSTGKTRWDVNISKTSFGQILSTQKYKARILAEDERDLATLGDEVFLSGTIIPISGKRNPEDFDYKQYLKSQNIHAQIRLDSLHQITSNNRIFEWVWWREKALGLVDQNFNEKTAPIAKALLVGYKQELDTESKTAFARAGLSHIMAVSGLHVGFIVAPFWVIIPWFWTKKYGSHIGFGLLLLLLLCYSGVTGFSPSVMRAS